MNEYCNKENNNNSSSSSRAYCYYHPKEFVVGVCHLCLNDKLLTLAAKQGLKNRPNSYKFLSSHKLTHNNQTNSKSNKSKPSISGLPKILAIGSSFLNRRDHRNRPFHQNCDRFNVDFADDLDSTSTSLEDESSFISIKFGENGVAIASWEDNINNSTDSSTVSNMSWSGQTSVKPKHIICNNFHVNNNNCKCKCECELMVEHLKPRALLRWQNRIGRLFHVIRWKRSTSARGNNAPLGAKASRKG